MRQKYHFIHACFATLCFIQFHYCHSWPISQMVRIPIQLTQNSNRKKVDYESLSLFLLAKGLLRWYYCKKSFCKLFLSLQNFGNRENGYLFARCQWNKTFFWHWQTSQISKCFLILSRFSLFERLVSLTAPSNPTNTNKKYNITQVSNHTNMANTTSMSN